MSFAHLRWQPWTLSMGCLQISSIACMHFLYTSYISSGSTLCEFTLGYRCSSHVEDNSLKQTLEPSRNEYIMLRQNWRGRVCLHSNWHQVQYTPYYHQHNFPHVSFNHNLHFLEIFCCMKLKVEYKNAKFIRYRQNLVYKFFYSL